MQSKLMVVITSAAVTGVMFMAANASAQDSSSISISATIPPLADIFAAEADGAVGAWTALHPNGALMLSLPETFSTPGKSDDRTISVYRSDDNRFTMLSSNVDGRVDVMQPVEVTAGRSLTRLDFGTHAEAFSPTTAPQAHVTMSAI